VPVKGDAALLQCLDKSERDAIRRARRETSWTRTFLIPPARASAPARYNPWRSSSAARLHILHF
jgi:hypothetical protein